MDLKAIGRRIKIAREQKGLTQEALAELVDLTPMHISVIERGFKPTKLETFCRIANVLGVSADTLLQDVIDCSAASVPSELDDLLKDLPIKERRKIYRCIEAYIEAYHEEN
jgi:transcriptional regulator with XRE-family HTH domain